MKRFITLVLMLICLGSIMSASALSLDESVSFFKCDEEKFQLFTKDSIATDNGIIFGMTETDFKDYMDSKNMLLYGAQKQDGHMTFNVTKSNTDFSNQVQTFVGVEEKELLKFAEKLTNHPADVVMAGGTPYIHMAYVDDTANTSFYVQQYITVHKGQLYALTVNTPGTTLSNDDATTTAEVLAGLSFKATMNGMTGTDIAKFVLILVLGAVLLALSVIVIRSLVLDWREAEKQTP